MSNFNLSTIGRVGNDATATQIGERVVINFSVAVTEKYKDEEKTSWLRFTYWGKSDKLTQYITKGKLIYVESDWFETTEKDGKYYTSFRVRKVNPFLEKSEKVTTKPTDRPESQQKEEPDDLPF